MSVTTLGRTGLVAAIGIGLSVVASTAGVAGRAATVRTGVIHAGHARFEVLSPTLIRVEYSTRDDFENRPTVVAQDRTPTPAYTVTRRHDRLVITTTSLRLRYRLGSGPFTPRNLTMAPRAGSWRAAPSWGSATHPGNLGGWVRALDNDTGPVALHPGLLTRRGWYLLDDSHDAVLTHRAPGFAARPAEDGYQDGYLFGYGRDFRTALRDLRTLAGPAPLLPRTAFGVWFSRYYPYSGSDYHRLLHTFRKHRVPLDTLSIDTDWKRQPSPLSAVLAGSVVGSHRAYSWNGWEWSHKLFPDPKRTIGWLHRHGVDVALNIHPSIDSSDPRYAATVARTGSLKVDPTCTVEQVDPAGLCHVFDLTKPTQVAAYFALHRPIAKDGVDEWWLDWCCDATTVNAPGLTPDTWFNRMYTQQLHRNGDRWLVLSRVGGSHQGGDGVAGPGDGIFAEHRYAIHFTGDTCATWKMLRFEARLTAEEGNVGIPYVSHDIGSFNGAPINGQCSPTAGASGAKDPPNVYARWVQFGVFQPILRLHSNHGARLPWQYPRAAGRVAARALRLREALVPYLYSAARTSYDTGLPITRSLYLQWPRQRAAYHHPSEYTVGSEVLVRPVTASGRAATVSVWFPPGRWVDYFTGKTFRGPSEHKLSVPLEQIPMFVKAGAVLPTEPSVTHTAAGPPHRLTLTVFAGRAGEYRLYDDAGTGFGYQHGHYTWTSIRHDMTAAGETLRIGPAVGRFASEPGTRRWTVVFRHIDRPASVVVNGQAVSWRYQASARTLVVRVAGPSRSQLSLRVRQSIPVSRTR